MNTLEEKELLEKLVVECSSYAEILRKLGKSNSGTATKLLKLKLDKINKHFSPSKGDEGSKRKILANSIR